MEPQPFISRSNLRILKSLQKRDELLQVDPKFFFPWFKPCRVKVLLVTDGFLDFSQKDFGLSTFVSVLQNDMRSYVAFDITLGHISPGVSDAAVMQGASGIQRSIKGFRFDDPSHFTPDMYDQVWLFGIERAYNSFQALRSTPTLEPQEIQNLNLFMNNGGGLFATGDHGNLGFALCSAIPRARSMRLWEDTSADNDLNEVSMDGRRRNDTNRRGHDGDWQFDDQSDDVPQEIQPKLYFSRISTFFRESYPHPLLCSHLGRINVMPDHAHEGECIEPRDMEKQDVFGNPEYPFGISGQVRPEVIARSTVLPGSGNGFIGGKELTYGHTFGSICAYDGHQAGVGRVVTDATWHHFVNVNLVGEIGDPDPIKRQGFMASAAGQAAFDKIKEYYINIGVWLSPTHKQSCFNTRLIWPLYAHHRVIESSVNNPSLRLREMSVHSLYSIGTHAVDVLGKKASQCRRLIWILDLCRFIMPELVRVIDPWDQFGIEPGERMPWVDPKPLMNLAIGAGIVALRDEIGEFRGEIDDALEQKIKSVFISGAKLGLDKGLATFTKDLHMWSKLELADEATYIVKGFVHGKKQKAFRGLRVKAVDQDFKAENHLGEEVKVDETGYFKIPYKASDFIIDGKERGGADIILYIYEGDKLLKRSKVYRNAPRILSVDIQLD